MKTTEGGDQVLALADGRRIGICVYGDPAGTPLLFLHGTPGSRLKFALAHEAGEALGLAIIAPDRWGYGLSDPVPAPSLSAFTDDMAALMDHMGCERFAVGGISGGGPYAAAVAARLPSRVTALALISPLGPVGDAECAGSLSRFQRVCFRTVGRSPRVVATVFRIFGASLRRAPRVAAMLATLRAGARDKALISDAWIAGHILGSFREGLRPGTSGPATDVGVFTRPWGIDLDAIRAPARLWIGTADTAVPLSAARLLARSIPGCAVTEMEGEGHFWVAANAGEVLGWIARTVREPVVAAPDGQ